MVIGKLVSYDENSITLKVGRSFGDDFDVAKLKIQQLVPYMKEYLETKKEGDLIGAKGRIKFNEDGTVELMLENLVTTL